MLILSISESLILVPFESWFILLLSGTLSILFKALNLSFEKVLYIPAKKATISFTL